MAKRRELEPMELQLWNNALTGSAANCRAVLIEVCDTRFPTPECQVQFKPDPGIASNFDPPSASSLSK